jgi:hypothetical protein
MYIMYMYWEGLWVFSKVGWSIGGLNLAITLKGSEYNGYFSDEREQVKKEIL